MNRLRGFAGSDPRFDATVQWYRSSAESSGNTSAAALFEAIGEGPTPGQRRAARSSVRENRVGERSFPRFHR